MKPYTKETEIYLPHTSNQQEALRRTTHMSIAAHQDDIEIMAYHGIEACFQQNDKFFTGVVVTNGSGSARDNIYQEYSDQDMIAVRKKEQKKAAYLGEFSALALLDYPSSVVKDKDDETVVNELVELIKECQPDIIYTHNLADKHDTHIGVATKTIKALRKLRPVYTPQKVYGCEVWRDLDWMNDDEKVMLDVSNHPNLAASLVEVFDSQIIGGKRYDLATIGRRLANATFNASHAVDESSAITYAMDLTPLILDDQLDITEYVLGYIERFKNNVKERINKMI
jgi:LmbE family N-acetylglucosaminyl deacetylase